jgi:hypothetical protein
MGHQIHEHLFISPVLGARSCHKRREVQHDLDVTIDGDPMTTNAHSTALDTSSALMKIFLQLVQDLFRPVYPMGPRTYKAKPVVQPKHTAL